MPVTSILEVRKKHQLFINQIVSLYFYISCLLTELQKTSNIVAKQIEKTIFFSTLILLYYDDFGITNMNNILDILNHSYEQSKSKFLSSSL